MPTSALKPPHTGVEECSFDDHFWVLLGTGLVVAFGVVTLGRKVVQTVSIDMAEINYMRYFLCGNLCVFVCWFS